MPARCPHCARFLRNDLVDSLSGGDAPCPHCGETLTAADVGVAGSGAEGDGAAGSAGEAAGGSAGEAAARAKREAGAQPPPGGSDELPVGDPLEGWDDDGEVIPFGEHRGWSGPSRPMSGALAGAAVGALAGLLLGRRRRGLAGALGAAIGAGAGALAASRLHDGEVIDLAV